MSRSGRAAYEHNKAKNWQTGQLPPRCVHCRRSWDTTVIAGAVHCEKHAESCDGTCGRDDWSERAQEESEYQEDLWQSGYYDE